MAADLFDIGLLVTFLLLQKMPILSLFVIISYFYEPLARFLFATYTMLIILCFYLYTIPTIPKPVASGRFQIRICDFVMLTMAYSARHVLYLRVDNNETNLMFYLLAIGTLLSIANDILTRSQAKKYKTLYEDQQLLRQSMNYLDFKIARLNEFFDDTEEEYTDDDDEVENDNDGEYVEGDNAEEDYTDDEDEVENDNDGEYVEGEDENDENGNDGEDDTEEEYTDDEVENDNEGEDDDEYVDAEYERILESYHELRKLSKQLDAEIAEYIGVFENEDA